MKLLIVFLAIIVITIQYIECSPVHHKHESDHGPSLGTKELIKLKVADAALKSSAALKAQGSVALAVASAPVKLAKKAARKVGLKVKKVAAGIVGAKALVVSKVSAAAAVAKAATAAKAGLIAKKAFGIKWEAKKELKEDKIHHLKHIKGKIPPHILEKGSTIIENSLNAVQKPMEAIKNQVITATKAVIGQYKPIEQTYDITHDTHDTPVVHRVDTIPYNPVVIRNDPIVATVVSGY